MLFSDLAFIYVFLPLTCFVYFLVGKKFKNLVLVIAGIIFYFYGEPKYGFLLLITTLITYLFGLVIAKKKKKIWLILAVSVSLGLLGYFKYLDFLITTFNSLLKMDLKLMNIILPIGISFYTFQQLSYLVDVYRQPEVVQKNLIDYATYIMLFPQLIAGPIVRYGDIRPQLKDHPVTREKLSAGIFRFVIGLGKKVLIANVLGELVTQLKIVSPTFTSAWVEAIAYTLQLYFDFSGYSDMAIGLGKMLGFEFLENFNYPLFATSITDFWRRWHISLGNWFRDYVYIPLGGNRVSKLKWLRNILVVWLLTGLWHGAHWNFVLWGLFFAFFLIIEKQLKTSLNKLPKILTWFITFVLVVISFQLFENTDLNIAFTQLKLMFNLGTFTNSETLYYLKSYSLILVMAFIGASPLLKNIVRKLDMQKGGQGVIEIGRPIVMVALLLLVTAYLIDGTFNPFLYFRF